MFRLALVLLGIIATVSLLLRPAAATCSTATANVVGGFSAKLQGSQVGRASPAAQKPPASTEPVRCRGTAGLDRGKPKSCATNLVAARLAFQIWVCHGEGCRPPPRQPPAFAVDPWASMQFLVYGPYDTADPDKRRKSCALHRAGIVDALGVQNLVLPRLESSACQKVSRTGSRIELLG
jgi:hypothetical protein